LGDGRRGVATVPRGQLFLGQREPAAPWRKYVGGHGVVARVDCGQDLSVDGLTPDSQGQVLCPPHARYAPRCGCWAEREAFRAVTVEELTPISPEVEDKRVVVDVTPTRQMLYCYEGKTEVYACQISSGAKWDAAGNLVEKWGTPLGPHPIWRKAISIHMS